MAFDLILKGGWVIDGSGGPPFRADVALARDDNRRRLAGWTARRLRVRSTWRGATLCPASSMPTCTATSCSWRIRPICRRCVRE